MDGWMYVCMYAWMDVCMHVGMYVCMYACMHACMQVGRYKTCKNMSNKKKWMELGHLDFVVEMIMAWFQGTNPLETSENHIVVGNHQIISRVSRAWRYLDP